MLDRGTSCEKTMGLYYSLSCNISSGADIPDAYSLLVENYRETVSIEPLFLNFLYGTFFPHSSSFPPRTFSLLCYSNEFLLSMLLPLDNVDRYILDKISRSFQNDEIEN